VEKGRHAEKGDKLEKVRHERRRESLVRERIRWRLSTCSE
jgi:hypothetical protein